MAVNELVREGSLLLLLAGLPVYLQDPVDEGDASQEEAPAPTPTQPARTDGGYHFLDRKGEVLSGWLGTGLCEELSLGESAGGRDLFAVQFGAPGPTPLDQRTTVLVCGGLDGVSLAGSEAVIAITTALLASPATLPADTTFVVVPWANPDGLARWIETGCSDGRNDRPVDDDRDGAIDEDRPDDLDGDGLVLEMLLEDPAGSWVRADGGRFLRRAREGEAPRYRRTREGRDDDGDGAFNEDERGGVVIDRNFPVNWTGPWEGRSSGPWPLSEPESRALADLALARRTALVLVFQGNHGNLAAPGGVLAGDGVLPLPFAADEPTYLAATELFARTTGREVPALARLREVSEEDRPGASIDWFYAALGALSFEVGVWGPNVDGPASETVEGLYPRSSDRSASDGFAQAEGRSLAASSHDQAWARWLDETRGGLGFVDWQPMDLGGGREGLVGGWEPYTRLNPPADVLPVALRELDVFVLELTRGLPRFEVEIVDGRRDGVVGILKARIRNAGTLPTGVGATGGDRGTRVTLVLPPGVQLISGEVEVDLGHIPGQGRSAVQDWLVVAPSDTVFRVRVESPWSPPIEKEVRL